MSLLNFLEAYLLWLVIGALIIIGFYIITRGEKETLPNGLVRNKGKIFKNWSLFWEQTTGTGRIYFNGEELKKKLLVLQEYNSVLGARVWLSDHGNFLETRQDVSPEEIEYMRHLLHCEIKFTPGTLFLFVEVPDYYFPEWLRFPLSQCPPCMASVGGTTLYWPLVLCGPDLFGWSPHPLAMALFFWVLFCLALSALNKLAYNLIGA